MSATKKTHLKKNFHVVNSFMSQISLGTDLIFFKPISLSFIRVYGRWLSAVIIWETVSSTYFPIFSLIMIACSSMRGMGVLVLLFVPFVCLKLFKTV